MPCEGYDTLTVYLNIILLKNLFSPCLGTFNYTLFSFFENVSINIMNFNLVGKNKNWKK